MNTEQKIEAEALKKYPVLDGFTTKGMPHEIYVGQKYKREGYIAGRSAGLEELKKEVDMYDKLEDPTVGDFITFYKRIKQLLK